jgi:hypothetical protein
MSETGIVSMGDLPDHLLESVFKFGSPTEWRQLRLTSKRLLGLVNMQITRLCCILDHHAQLQVLIGSSSHFFPRLAHLTIACPCTTNEGLMELQQAFSTLSWNESEALSPDDSDTSSSDDGGCESHLGLFIRQSLPYLQHLTSLGVTGQMGDDELEALILCLPASCVFLSLPLGNLSFHKLNRLALQRTGLSLSLTAQKTIYDASVLAKLPALMSSLREIEITLMGQDDVCPLVTALVNTRSLNLSWPCSGSVSNVAQSCSSLLSFLESLPQTTSLSCLHSLSLNSFLCSVPSLIVALAPLPSLRRLDVFSFNINHYITMTSLSLIAHYLPLLEHLGSNGIDLTVDPGLPADEEWGFMLDQAQLCLEAIKSIEVGICVVGQGRLRDVFPNLERAHMRWSWSSLTRKTAGLLRLKDLSIACPEYLSDARLLRTLPHLRRFKLAKGYGLAIISDALESLENCALEEFSLTEWIEGKQIKGSDADEARLISSLAQLKHLQSLTLLDVSPGVAKIILTGVLGYFRPHRVKLSVGLELRGLADEAVRGSPTQSEIELSSMISKSPHCML